MLFRRQLGGIILYFLKDAVSNQEVRTPNVKEDSYSERMLRELQEQMYALQRHLKISIVKDSSYKVKSYATSQPSTNTALTLGGEKNG